MTADDSIPRKEVDALSAPRPSAFTSALEALSYREIAAKEGHERQRFPDNSMQTLRGGQ